MDNAYPSIIAEMFLHEIVVISVPEDLTYILSIKLAETTQNKCIVTAEAGLNISLHIIIKLAQYFNIGLNMLSYWTNLSSFKILFKVTRHNSIGRHTNISQLNFLN